MTKSARLQIRVSPEDKARAEKVFESMGLSMSSAVNMFINQSIRVGGLPFNNSSDSPAASGGDRRNG